MYMVSNSANREWLHSILASDTADLWPKARLEFRLNKAESLLCTEGGVHEVTDIRIIHEVYTSQQRMKIGRDPVNLLKSKPIFGRERTGVPSRAARLGWW